MADFRARFQAAAAALKTPKALAVAACASLFAMTAALWVANASLIDFTIRSPLFVFGEKVSIVASSLLASFSIFDRAVLAETVVMVLLFGVNAALSAQYVGRRFRFGRSLGLSVVGAVVGMLGIGCAACGSVILASVLGIGATAGILQKLPLGGLEFGLLGIGIMLASIDHVAGRLADPDACKIR